MSRRLRLAVFFASAAVLGVALVAAVGKLPDFGHAHEIYGLMVARHGVSATHATDLVTALNFDIRGFDTMGEEFILFAAVTGVVMLLRELRGEDEDPHTRAEEHHFAGASDSVRALCLGLAPPLVALGGYVAVHGHLTPGGGFQAGVILACGPLVVFLAGRYLAMRFVAPHVLVEGGEALGAAGYVLLGLAGLIAGGAFFENFLPRGTVKMLLSAGQIPIASVIVALEVAGGFLLGWREFLDQAMVVRAGDEG